MVVMVVLIRTGLLTDCLDMKVLEVRIFSVADNFTLCDTRSQVYGAEP